MELGRKRNDAMEICSGKTERVIKEPAVSLSGVCYQESLTPEWFLSELLCRLGLKDLFRFKCVSRQCLHFISDPSFQHLYSSFRGPNFLYVSFPPRVVVFDKEGHRTLFHELRTENFPRVGLLCFPNMRQRSNDGMYCISAADKGFLLLEKDENGVSTKYYLCNAMTKQWFTLPPHRFSGTPYVVGLITQIKDGVLASYKVVKIHSQSKTQNFLDVEIFSSETRRWAALKLNFEHSILSAARVVVVNNKLHWMMGYGSIYIYDVYINPNEIHIVDRPVSIGPETFTYEYGVCKGGFKYFEIHGRNITDEAMVLTIWELQEDHQWLIQHSVRFADISFPDGYENCIQNNVDAIFLSFHPLDPDIMFFYWGEREEPRSLVSYNMKTRRMQFPRDCHNRYIDPLKVDFFQMLWPTPIPSSLMIPVE